MAWWRDAQITLLGQTVFMATVLLNVQVLSSTQIRAPTAVSIRKMHLRMFLSLVGHVPHQIVLTTMRGWMRHTATLQPLVQV